MNTCVLCFSRRKALQCTMRSRSRWNGERSEHSSGSGCSLPWLADERTASGSSSTSSAAARRARNPAATGPFGSSKPI
jgi:hypothetical protein